MHLILGGIEKGSSCSLTAERERAVEVRADTEGGGEERHAAAVHHRPLDPAPGAPRGLYALSGAERSGGEGGGGPSAGSRFATE
ncbi:hypothetical protein NQZ68_034204 [Dissostichus eleginoides]|nr:hypothetical protein NQZ68_034204 [Dissostichus eleginoides]